MITGKNEISLVVKIEEADLGRKVQIVGDRNKSDVFENKNTELYLNTKLIPFSKFFIPKKKRYFQP